MVARNIQLGFFFVVFAIITVLAFFIFKPYINVLILSGTFAVIFYPLFKKVSGQDKSKFNRSVASILTIIFILAIVLLPLTLIGFRVFEEGQGVYERLQEANRNETSLLSGIPDSDIEIIAKFQQQSRAILTRVGEEPEKYVEQAGQWIQSNLGPLSRSAVGAFLGIFIWLFSLFYFLRDGAKIKKIFVTASPLSDRYDNEIIQRINRAVKSVIGGTLVVALIQGILTGIGFYLFGVPLPAIWGLVAVIAALIPTVGTAAVNVPAVIYLALTGHPIAAIILLVWALGLVGTVDNFLRPILIERGTQVHPLVILLSVLGGIALFGPIGFITGPLIMTLLSEFTSIYRQLVLRQERRS